VVQHPLVFLLQLLLDACDGLVDTILQTPHKPRSLMPHQLPTPPPCLSRTHQPRVPLPGTATVKQGIISWTTTRAHQCRGDTQGAVGSPIIPC
jgi:hypothetical protein